MFPVMEALDNELSRYPIAYGHKTDGKNPATDTVATTNFKVAQLATQTKEIL